MKRSFQLINIYAKWQWNNTVRILMKSNVSIDTRSMYSAVYVSMCVSMCVRVHFAFTVEHVTMNMYSSELNYDNRWHRNFSFISIKTFSMTSHSLTHSSPFLLVWTAMEAMPVASAVVAAEPDLPNKIKRSSTKKGRRSSATERKRVYKL